ncbi:hypothetical protein [Homoserinimonas hongtaonis]|uniref:Uncharacterized protein n=1 Tax=Homoserinimonas hongtaonis TaxID=2079791 RepID=A0A2U1T220_9MICO|nr:hypothetical protein [Salinibacterium hongtaonis]PWB97931.1 hypothetical protein DF220_08885 [Salinibacterium hongtaonis]
MTFDPYANQGGAAAWDPAAAAASNEAADQLFAAEISDVSDADVSDAEYVEDVATAEDAEFVEDVEIDGDPTQPYDLSDPDV